MPGADEREIGDTRIIGRVVPLATVPELPELWQSLERESDCSFFQSWIWMGTWINTVADRRSLIVFECRRKGVLLGLGLLGAGTVKRRAFVRSRQLVLGESATDAHNVQVECNELLSRRGDEKAVTAALLAALATMDNWDELKVAYGHREVWTPYYAASGLRAVIDSTSPTWVVQLTRQTTVESLLAGLSSNRRSQLRRSIKEFEKSGPISVSVAAGTDEAVTYFRELGHLHTQRWQEKGRPGAFAKAAWVRFHEALIRGSFEAGGVQLLCIRCGEEIIGYIYNLLWRGRVLMLQTGFVRDTSNVRRAGYVSHLFAMQLNASLGMNMYDFMPGDENYKSVLADRGPVYESVRFQRKRVKFHLEAAAVDAVRKWRRWRTMSPFADADARP